jgi:peroxiredoxin
MIHPFGVGDTAPEATLPDYNGKELSFSSLWKSNKMTVFIFLRHFGCPNCRVEIGDLGENRVKLASADLKVVLIGISEPDVAKEFQKKYHVPFTILCDSSRRIYARYQLFEASAFREFNPTNMIPTMNRARKLGGNPFSAAFGNEMERQLGGVFAIDQKGTVQYAYRSRCQVDFPTANELLKALNLVGLG